MKRFCFLAVLIALSSSAHAGRSISFSVGSHRVHIESSRHCRSVRAPRCRSPNASTGATGATAMRTSATRRCRQSLCQQCRRRSRRPPRRRPRRRPRPSSPRRRRRLHGGRLEKLYRRCACRAAPPPVQERFNTSAAGAVGRKTGRDRAARGAGRARRASGRGRSAVGFSDRRLADRRQGNGADRQSAAMRCAASCSVHRTRRAKRS